MNYVDKKIEEIIEANNNKMIIRDILLEMYWETQMDSSVRADFEDATGR